jgi:hypothetical protein
MLQKLIHYKNNTIKYTNVTKINSLQPHMYNINI